jgi:hypothetical protein
MLFLHALLGGVVTLSIGAPPESLGLGDTRTTSRRLRAG